MQDKQVFVFHEEGLELSVLSQCLEMMENAKMFYVSSGVHSAQQGSKFDRLHGTKVRKYTQALLSYNFMGYIYTLGKEKYYIPSPISVANIFNTYESETWLLAGHYMWLAGCLGPSTAP